MTAERPGGSRSSLWIPTYEGLAGPWPDPAGLQPRSKLQLPLLNRTPQIISTEISPHSEKRMGVFLWVHAGLSVTVDSCSWLPTTSFSDCRRMPPRLTFDSAWWCKLCPDRHVWWWRWRHLRHLNFKEHGGIRGVWSEDKEDISCYWQVISSKTYMHEWMNTKL